MPEKMAIARRFAEIIWKNREVKNDITADS